MVLYIGAKEGALIEGSFKQLIGLEEARGGETEQPRTLKKERDPRPLVSTFCCCCFFLILHRNKPTLKLVTYLLVFGCTWKQNIYSQQQQCKRNILHATARSFICSLLSPVEFGGKGFSPLQQPWVFPKSYNSKHPVVRQSAECKQASSPQNRRCWSFRLERKWPL